MRVCPERAQLRCWRAPLLLHGPFYFEELGMPGKGGQRRHQVVYSRYDSALQSLMSHGSPSPVKAHEGSQILAAPRLPGDMQGKSEISVLGGSTVAASRSVCGDSLGVGGGAADGGGRADTAPAGVRGAHLPPG